MNVWNILNNWAGKRLNALTITLLDASGPEAALVGEIAALESREAPPLGPLTAAPFWPADWSSRLKEALSQIIPETGLLMDIENRRYALFPLTYDRSALVVGGGHVGAALSRLLSFLDFKVTLMDDRPEFLAGADHGVTPVQGDYGRLGDIFPEPDFDAVIIVTRGHAHDSECLRQALSWPRPPLYLGMIGSRGRARRTLEMMANEGFDPQRVGRVHAPVGLNIGAQTPAEIAVSIAAEIIQAFNRLDG